MRADKLDGMIKIRWYVGPIQQMKRGKDRMCRMKVSIVDIDKVAIIALNG